MIPKKLHYIWLGHRKLTPEAKHFIKTWKEHMPDYEIKCWDESSFDCDSIPWVKQAIEKKMWAFAADYIRLYALYTEGGIYMDTDVEVRRSFDSFLQYSFFSSNEIFPEMAEKNLSLLDENHQPKTPGTAIHGFGILSAIMGAEPGNTLVKDCMEYYNHRDFVNKDGSLNVIVIIPDVIGIEAVKYGFRYINETQYLENQIAIFHSSVFAGNLNDIKDDTYAIHYGEGSWRKLWWPRRKKLWYCLKTSTLHLFGLRRTFQ